ncbi:MAG: hypothetical protein E6R08_05715 [Nevskiaceae bacterium]|nr:MAG: hypothetical protein E6R08_05715 [Nevskiaceae bacterium]
MSCRIHDANHERTTKGPTMNARQTTAKHATTMLQVLTRMQAAANTIPNEERINWGHAEQMHDALKYAVYAAFAMGVVSEDEARDLGFPV